MRPDEGCDWSRHYPDIGQDLEEDFPRDFPPMLGMKPVTVTIWFDADNGHDQRNGRSIIGILVYIGKTPVKWSSKRQGAVETGTYGSEFIAGRSATKEALGITYVLRSWGVRIKGPVQIIGDNESVMKSSSIPKVELKKKWVALSYHRLRECTAAGIIAGRWIPGLENKSNLLTKSLNGPQLLKECNYIWVNTRNHF